MWDSDTMVASASLICLYSLAWSLLIHELVPITYRSVELQKTVEEGDQEDLGRQQGEPDLCFRQVQQTREQFVAGAQGNFKSYNLNT